MGIKLLRGRLLDATDRQGAAKVMVVNATLARELFPGDDAIGHAIRLGGPDTPDRTIVGVVADVRHPGLDAAPGYQLYVPLSQWAWAETQLTLVLRATDDAAALASPLRAIVRDLDSAQPLTDVRTYDDVIASTMSSRRLAVQLLTAFAVVALMLAVVGLSGSLGVVASQRRQEIGLRLALGADRAQIGRLLLLQGLRPAVAGLIAGLIIVALTGGVLQSLLYGINGFDRTTFAYSAALMLLAAAGACAVPARRAGRVDPAGVLRG
jgi:ABC-type antimicrobial peptide transport system permease subunit